MRNVAHADLMIAFYKDMQSKEVENKEKHGKIGLKIAQLEDSRDEEVKFIDYINTL